VIFTERKYDMNIQKVVTAYGEKNISTKQFDDMFDVVVDDTLKKLKAFPKYIAPTLLVIESVDNVLKDDIKGVMHQMILDQEFEDQSEKDMRLMILGASFISRRIIPLALFFIAEAWEKNRYTFDSVVSMDGNNQEIIIVAGLTIDGRSSLCVIPVKRSKAGKMLPLINIEIHYAKDKYKTTDNILQNIFNGFFTACEANSTVNFLRHYAQERYS